MRFNITLIILFIIALSPILAEEYQERYEQAIEIDVTNPDSALRILKSIVAAREASPSILLQSHIASSRIQSRLQDFSSAFDCSGEALSLAAELKDSLALGKVKMQMGRLYDEFRKKTLAFSYFDDAKLIFETLVSTGQMEREQMISVHFNLAMHYKLYEQYDKALQHLDTCALLHIASERNDSQAIYHEVETADIITKQGDTQTSLELLHTVEANILEQSKANSMTHNYTSYIIIVYVYLGNAYLQEGDYSKATHYYNKALTANDDFETNHSSLSYIYEKMAEAQFNEKNFESAFLSLKKAKEITESTTGLNSSKNSNLIEIKSQYQEQIEEQRLALLTQENLLASQRQRLLVFRVLFVILVSLILIGFLLYRNRLQRIHFKREKEEIVEEGKEVKHALEVKNKELTAYTLQFIEKEKTIESLREKLQEIGKDDSSVNHFLQQNQSNSDALWDEFNTRFVEVNAGFYERLQKKHPSLSATERKHCALIKLNFSAKEMAHLLNISPSSVHVSRYRLRKRFNLEKSENLTDFIAKI